MHVRFSSVRCSFRLCTGNNHGTLPLFPVHMLGGSGCSWRGNCTSNITFEACRKCNGSSVMRVPFCPYTAHRLESTIVACPSTLPECVAKSRHVVFVCHVLVQITVYTNHCCSNHCVHNTTPAALSSSTHGVFATQSMPQTNHAFPVKRLFPVTNQSRVDRVCEIEEQHQPGLSPTVVHLVLEAAVYTEPGQFRKRALACACKSLLLLVSLCTHGHWR